MVAHGFRGEDKASHTRNPFKCGVCGTTIKNGTIVAAFRNQNKPERSGWDHVCAEKCADLYVSPPLKMPAPKSSVRSALSSAFYAITGFGGSASHGSERDDEAFFRQASACEIPADTALEMLAEHGGDRAATVQAMGLLYTQQLTSMEAAAGEMADDALSQCSACDVDKDSDDEHVPELAAMPALKSEDARRGVLDVFLTFVKPILPK